MRYWAMWLAGKTSPKRLSATTFVQARLQGLLEPEVKAVRKEELFFRGAIGSVRG